MARFLLLSLTLLLPLISAQAAADQSGTGSWAPDSSPLPTERERALKLVRHECRGELGLFCNGTKKNDEAAAECLVKHQTDLTKGCRSALAAAQPSLESKTKLHPKKTGSAGETP